MNVFDNELYRQDVKAAAMCDLPWEKLQDRTVLLSGASGMIGSCLVDVLQYRNQNLGMNCKAYVIGRSEKKARERFTYCWHSPWFEFILGDIDRPVSWPEVKRVDYILHLASNTHPVAYATDPIGTITTNIIGTNNMLRFAVEHKAERFLFASSVEIYGENRGDVEKFDEAYLGYLDCNTLRAGYPESKRCGEALCQAYKKQYELNVVIPRLSRVYGPTMLMSDTKASSQFILKAADGEDVVLKSPGEQYYSYIYVADAVSGILTVLLKGKNGEAYNIADENSDIRLKDFAQLCAETAGTKVVFDIPDADEAAGFSKATKARLSNEKIRTIGWRARTGLRSGIEETIQIIRE